MNAKPKARKTPKPPRPRKEPPLRLRRRESVAAGLKRLARAVAGCAAGELRGRGGRDRTVRAIHEARKGIKKLRAILRLAGREMGRGVFRKENRLLRDAGRKLSGMRDAEVRLKTFDGFLAQSGLDPARFAGVRSSLETAVDAGAYREARRRIAEARRILEELGGRAGSWPLEGIGRGDLEKELRRTYKKGRKALRAFLAEPDSEHLHTIRKRAKDLGHQLRLAKSLLPPSASAVAEEARRVAELAGSEHDLAVLREALAGPEPPAGHTAALIAEIDARRRELRSAAREHCLRLFGEKPREFLCRSAHEEK